jgi:hypothetical protein
MIKITENGVLFDFTEEEIIDSMKAMKRALSILKNEPAQENDAVTKAIQTAFEVMTAYWCMNFGEDDDNEIDMQKL